MLIDLAQRVKAAAAPDLRVLAEEAGFVPKGGKGYQCAMHEDRHASAYLCERIGRIKCLGPCGQSWDVIDLARIIVGGSVGEAIRWLAARYGVSYQSPTRRVARLSPEVYTNVELFRIGFRWQINRYLDLLKQLWDLDETEPECARIRDWTSLLERVENWSSYQMAQFYIGYRRHWPTFVNECVVEAEEYQVLFATILAHADTKAAVAA